MIYEFCYIILFDNSYTILTLTQDSFLAFVLTHSWGKKIICFFSFLTVSGIFLERGWSYRIGLGLKRVKLHGGWPIQAYSNGSAGWSPFLCMSFHQAMTICAIPKHISRLILSLIGKNNYHLC